MTFFKTRLAALSAYLRRQYPNLSIDEAREETLYTEAREELLPMIADTVTYVHKAIHSGKRVLVEGANATMLDIDFGTFPYVTSSNPSIGSVCTGLGVPPHHIGRITAIVKAYCTRVGEGPFPTELDGELDARLRAAGQEFGTTTGRPRRCGWIDIPQLRYANMINGFSDVNLTKLDVLSGFDIVRIGVGYRDKRTGQVVTETVPASLEVSNCRCP
jgi:adenylosuccinate synthase